jgi:hypothetical protein
LERACWPRFSAAVSSFTAMLGCKNKTASSAAECEQNML